VSVYQTSADGLRALSAAFRRSFESFRPKPKLTLSEWADKFAYIPPEAGASPGKFYTSSAEYQRGMQDALTDPDIETVVLMMCSQSGKTQMQLNAVGYFSHYEPSPMLFVQASEGEAEKFSKNRISKMIRATPVLRDLFPNPRARDSGNTLLNKEFPGGVLVLAGANAPAGLASMPVRILQMDEVDRYPDSAGTEGDPVDLADRRTTTFWNRKKALASTPGVKDHSRIENAMADSDQRRYFVPCPHCGEMQQFSWRRLHYKLEEGTDKPRLLEWWYVCVSGCEILEQSKHEMIRKGEWRATAKSRDGKTAGFHLNALYPPWIQWRDLINEWLAAKGSLERRKTFINTRLAETWEIRGKGADLHELEKRKSAANFAEMLPAGVLFLTAGVDVQDDRLEATIYGWGMDEERWAVDHQIFRGDPSLPETMTGADGRKVRNELSPWANLEDYLREPFDHELGVSVQVACALFDSGGHHTARVYEFTKKNEARRWHAIVGRGGIGKPLVSRGSEQGPSHAMLYSVGVDTAKEDIYTSFAVTEPGPAYCHFSAGLDPEYFRQVTSEQLVKVKKDYVTKLQWVKKGERNEALDCFVYARAAVAILKPNYKKITANLKATAERLKKQRDAAAVAEKEEKVAPVEETPPQSAPKTPKPSSNRIDRLAKAFSATVTSR
jgi:phage terminase large subunit GpA-like protein